MQISVIIPVFNAGSFVTQAVESALAQPETAEVVLVEDGSLDNSWKVCQHLAAQYEKVHLFRHQEGMNRGAGASRNLGMKESAFEYIAFLDADDYYLPARFSVANKIFLAEPDCEGVYEAIGKYVEDQVGLQRWREAKRPDRQMTTMTEPVAPERLGEVLISGGYGHFSLDGLVLKKSVLNKSGFMHEGLKLHQDTNFIFRVSLVSRLLPGRLDEPVSMWRVHDHNRISAPRSDNQKYDERMLFWMATYRWCKTRAPKEIQEIIINNMILDTISITHFRNNPRNVITRRWLRMMRLFAWFQRYPEVLLEPRLWQSLSRLKTSKGKDI